MANQIHNLELFADYFQFYVCDEHFQADTGTIWDHASTDRMLALADDLVAVGTARNMDVPLRLELLDAEPAADFDRWDQVIDCSASFPGGTIIAFGCTEVPEEAERFSVQPGPNRVRVSYANLDDLSDDGLEGNDSYRVQIWPGQCDGVQVLKPRT